MNRWILPAAALSLGLGCASVEGGAADQETESSATDTGATGPSGSDVSTSGDCGDGCETEDASTVGDGSEAECGDGLDDDGDQQFDCDDPDCQDDPACGDGTIRVATWNTLRIDPVGSPEFDALVAIVRRLDADILCVQEVGEGEESSLQALAEAGGYVDGVLAPVTGPPGVGIANACMSRTPTADAAYLWSDWISSDPSARDLTRPFVRLRTEVPNTGRFVSIVAAHLKAGDDEVDLFRRMVESIRLGQAATAESSQYPTNAIIVLGDLNDTGRPNELTFSSLPPGLPSFYNLGNDIQLPITYAPAAPLTDAGLTHVDARLEDSDENETFIPADVRLDYVYVSGAEVLASEVYEACRDEPPTNDGVDKAGEPLDCGLSEIASDHRPVVVELRL